MQDDDSDKCAECGTPLTGEAVVQLTLASQVVCVPCAFTPRRQEAEVVERDNDGR